MHTVLNSPVAQEKPISIDDVKKLVEAYLEDHFRARIQQAGSIDAAYAQLWESIYVLFKAGGKRIRSYATILAYQSYASGAPIDVAVPAAAAQEMLHIAMLIHDDIIDRDTTRYGIQNISGQYELKYSGRLNDVSGKEQRHFAMGTALLAGDLLLSDSYALVQQCSVSPQVASEAHLTINEAIFSVIGGELLDIESSFPHGPKPDPLLVAYQKTASYSFISPFVMGAQLAGADSVQITALRRLGKIIGVAYQMRDDILGIFGDQRATGKSTSSDILEGKHTYLVQILNRRASGEQLRIFSQAFGVADASADSIHAARQVIESSGTLEAAEHEIAIYYAKAQACIEELHINTASKNAFYELLERCLKRGR